MEGKQGFTLQQFACIFNYKSISIINTLLKPSPIEFVTLLIKVVVN
jgi:hypothetical protein